MNRRIRNENSGPTGSKARLNSKIALKRENSHGVAAAAQGSNAPSSDRAGGSQRGRGQDKDRKGGGKAHGQGGGRAQKGRGGGKGEQSAEPHMSSKYTKEELIARQWGLSTNQVKRVKALLRMGVCEEDLVIADRLIKLGRWDRTWSEPGRTLDPPPDRRLHDTCERPSRLVRAARCCHPAGGNRTQRNPR